MRWLTSLVGIYPYYTRMAASRGSRRSLRNEFGSFRPTPRQEQILELVAAGRTDKEIAEALSISTKTVRTHLGRLFRESKVSSRAQAVALWIRVQMQASEGAVDAKDDVHLRGHTGGTGP